MLDMTDFYSLLHWLFNHDLISDGPIELIVFSCDENELACVLVLLSLGLHNIMW